MPASRPWGSAWAHRRRWPSAASQRTSMPVSSRPTTTRTPAVATLTVATARIAAAAADIILLHSPRSSIGPISPKAPLHVGRSNTWLLGLKPVCLPTQHLNRLSRFCRARGRDQHADRLTEINHATSSVAIVRIYTLHSLPANTRRMDVYDTTEQY